VQIAGSRAASQVLFIRLDDDRGRQNLGFVALRLLPCILCLQIILATLISVSVSGVVCQEAAAPHQLLRQAVQLGIEKASQHMG